MRDHRQHLRRWYARVTQALARRARPGAQVLSPVILCATAAAVHADGAALATFVRTDSNHTLVVSPHLQVERRIDATSASLSYAADVWTSASIDVVAAASPAITEQRDELNIGLAHDLADIRIALNYRYSVEIDYVSHGTSGGLTWDFAENNSSLTLEGQFFADQVGRSGTPGFARGLATLNARIAFTQVLGENLLAQVTYELGHLQGYQASPYRYVGIAGTGFGCEAATLCVPERTPPERLRHALAGRVRQALLSSLAIELNYRYYLDDWAMTSHTALAQLRWLVGEETLLSFGYRYYQQSAADFYRARYVALESLEMLRTRDRELSAMMDHRAVVSIEHNMEVGTNMATLVLSLTAGAGLYLYDNFVGLHQVQALDVTAGIALQP